MLDEFIETFSKYIVESSEKLLEEEIPILPHVLIWIGIFFVLMVGFFVLLVEIAKTARSWIRI
ncbi:MAG: hypothetical protein QW303_03360 [Nitrososphaerota archaeon]